MGGDPRPILFRSFYPGEPVRQIAEFLSREPPVAPAAKRLVAAAAPHAGWRYSGGVAARALKALADRSSPRALVLLGAVHREWLEASAVYPSGSWETPLGPVPVDRDLAAEVLRELAGLVEENPGAHASEHSLEVLLPMVHEIFPGVPVVPVMVPPEAAPEELGRRLARVVADRVGTARAVAAVASTDLTHYGPHYGFTPAGTGEKAHAWMQANDRRILSLAERLEAESIPREAHAHRNACGAGALAACVAFARELGSRGGTVLEHTDSFEVAREDSELVTAVGYAGIVF
ncbi:MAG: AmmeMemoRadiSam system protein B [Planctomycetes bacterium]|nr:AmmeMemoRadiSam system protein B [Planctomycetota bacterium]